MPEPKAPKSAPPGAAKPGFLQMLAQYRRELTFIGIFIVLLGGGFTLISLQQVNDAVIEPFTGLVAKASGVALKVIGQKIVMKGTQIQTIDPIASTGQRFGVNIRNGCNGVETMIIFLSAVFAFPASWKARFAGLAIGVLAIQAVNLVRVVALFLTGVYFPSFFDSSHTVIWQTIVILFGVLLWVFWASRFASQPATATAPAEQG